MLKYKHVDPSQRKINHVFWGVGPIRFVHYLAKELPVIFSVLFPIIFYLLLRSEMTDTRSFTPKLVNLLSSSAYWAIGQSFIQQFGIIFIFFLGGCVLLILRREYATVSFFLLLLIGIPMFQVTDNLALAGYSRFNLFILAPILAGSTNLINWMLNRQKVVSIVIACAFITANLFMSPINLDGTKDPYWGNYLADTSEHYYPYPQVLKWLEAYAPHGRYLFAGMNYNYFFDFYFDQLKWYPDYEIFNRQTSKNETTNITRALDKAKRNNDVVVVYQLLGKDAPYLKDTGDFHESKVFRNMAHSLVIFIKN